MEGPFIIDRCHINQSRTRTRRLRRAGRNILVMLTPMLLLVLLINVFVVEAALIKEGPSMQPNLYRGYRVVMDKVSYRFHPPQRGDVVIVEPPAENKSLIKRVVALPGETVEVREGHVYIDGKPIAEPWVAYFGGPDYPATLVPPGHVFVLGDNRAHSRDSRTIGPVSMRAIRGRARLIFWPLNHAGMVK